jgi:hypothetical protein
MNGVLNNANRDTGDWLPGVERCPHRMVPCGNPQCADEALKSGQNRAAGSSHASQEAKKRALRAANNCSNTDCPLEHATGLGILAVLAHLFGS